MVPEIWILETVSSSLPTHPVLVRTLVIRVTFLNIEKPGGHIQKLPKLINKASHKEFLEPSIHAASAIILQPNPHPLTMLTQSREKIPLSLWIKEISSRK